MFIAFLNLICNTHNLLINNTLFPSGINNDNNQNIEIALFDIKDNLDYLYTLNCHNIN